MNHINKYTVNLTVIMQWIKIKQGRDIRSARAGDCDCNFKEGESMLASMRI